MKSTPKVHENLSLENIEGEIWKDIPNYEGYYQLVLRTSFDKDGYLRLTLSRNGKRKNLKNYKLVAVTFLNHTFEKSKKVVDHKDNNKLNNHVDNLQIISSRLNSSKDRKNKTSKYTGVSWKRSINRWISSIIFNGKCIHLGCFKEEEIASTYYQNALIAIKNGTEIVRCTQRTRK